ncbi:hypothetical protein D9619_013498 [Psilocybe cf. subviscida]|uniref:Uncharacterized protein n=1 Tax=Psilocybe cf. subviscida TaxID=2480587 RepID=A0A8H5BH31_9AGAR|nr:hypothetical protein D9619_013498 [Psilocybe cf. subviscida]
MASLPDNMPPPAGVHSIINSNPGTSPTRTSGSLFSMSNKTAIITGGGRGIGLEIAVAYAEAGAVAYCLDLAEEPSDDWQKCRAWIDALPPASSAQHKGRLEYAQCDVTQQKPLWDLVQRIADKEGGVHVCVAAAGITEVRDVLGYEEDAFEKVMKVNTSGVLFAAQAAGRQMVAHGIKGSIILIASMAGSIALRGVETAAYNASKAAVLQLSRSLACELGPKGVRCNTISPGWVYSDMTKDYYAASPELMLQSPLGRLANLDEMRGVALFLGSEASTFCTGSK